MLEVVFHVLEAVGGARGNGRYALYTRGRGALYTSHVGRVYANNVQAFYPFAAYGLPYAEGARSGRGHATCAVGLEVVERRVYRRWWMLCNVRCRSCNMWWRRRTCDVRAGGHRGRTPYGGGC